MIKKLFSNRNLLCTLRKHCSYNTSLNNTSNMFTEIDSINIDEELKSHCKNLGFSKLTKVQKEVYEKFLNKESQKHLSVFAESGSGKTFAYGLPLIKTLQDLKKREDYDDMHGAIIILPTKELCTQTYAFLRKLDYTNKLKMNRTGSISHVAPHVQLLKSMPKEDLKKLDLEELSDKNIINSTKWDNQDLLITTPSQLNIIQKAKKTVDPLDINPSYIIIDEMDLLFEDQNFNEPLMNIMSHFFGQYRSPFGEENNKRKLILSSASLKNRMRDIPSKELQEDYFGPIEWVQSENYQKISENILFENVNIQRQDMNERIDKFRVVTKQNLEEGFRKIMVFCEDSKTIDLLKDLLEKSKIKCFAMHSQMRPEKRLESLMNFQKSDGVLLATDLACRGLDFQGLDLIIQYNYATDATTLLHRVGRISRQNKKSKSKVINFVDTQNLDLFDIFSKQVSKQNRLDKQISYSPKKSTKNKEKSLTADQINEISSDEDF